MPRRRKVQRGGFLPLLAGLASVAGIAHHIKNMVEGHGRRKRRVVHHHVGGTYGTLPAGMGRRRRRY